MENRHTQVVLNMWASEKIDNQYNSWLVIAHQFLLIAK